MTTETQQFATAKAKDILVKFGSETIGQTVNGEIIIQTEFLKRAAKGIKQIMEAGGKALIVSSGSAQLGRIEATKNNLGIKDRRTLSFLGSRELDLLWKDIFLEFGLHSYLLLINNIHNDLEYIENSLEIIDSGGVMVYNENDIFSQKKRSKKVFWEDNDTMAAKIATDYRNHSRLDIQDLVICSSIDGYIQDFDSKKSEELQNLVKTLNLKEIKKLLKLESKKLETHKSTSGTGGIVTKLKCMQMFLEGGGKTGYIVDSQNADNFEILLNAILLEQEYDRGTVFSNKSRQI
jgi:glutamate 5-kinase